MHIIICLSHHGRSAGGSNERGMSLIEMMFGLIIGALLIFGVLQVFTGAKTSNALMIGSTRAQESGRYSLDVMVQQARMAGLRSSPEDLPESRFSGNRSAINGSNGAALSSILVGSGEDARAPSNTKEVTSTRTVIVPIGDDQTRSITVKQDSDLLVLRYMGIADVTIRDCLSRAVPAGQYAVDMYYVAVNDLSNIDMHGAGRTALLCVSDRISADGSTGNKDVDADGFEDPPQLIAEHVVDFQVRFGEDTSDDKRANRFLAAGTPGLVMQQVVALDLQITAQTAKPIDALSRSESNQSVSNNGIGRQTGLQRQFSAQVQLRNLAP